LIASICRPADPRPDVERERDERELDARDALFFRPPLADALRVCFLFVAMTDTPCR
jgi:hypothetical protein